MKTKFLRIRMLAWAILFSLCAFAQETTGSANGQNAEIEQEEPDWSDMMPLEVTPSKEQYTDMYVLLEKKQVKAFIENLRKYLSKAIMWKETANRGNVRNMEKRMYKGWGIKKCCYCAYATFNVDGITLKKYYYHGMIEPGLFIWGPIFNVDANGDCYVIYKGNGLGTFCVSTGKTYESSTTVGTPGLFGITPRASGHSTSQELMKYEPGNFSIRIPVSGIDAYIAMLEEGLRHFDTKKAEKKLFK